MAERKPFPVVPLLFAAAAFLYAVYSLRHVLMPFLLSLALAYILNPLVNFCETRGLRRDLTVVFFYLLVAGGVTLLASSMIDTVTRELALLQSQAPFYLAKSKAMLASVQKEVARHLPFGAKAVAQWDAKLYAPVIEKAQNIPGYLLGLFPLLSFLFLIPFITFFLLLDAGRLIGSAVQAVPSRYVEQILHLISEVDTSLGNYLRGVIIVALVIAAASLAGLWAMNVNYAFAIAVLAGFTSFVPYLGAIIGAVVGGLVAGFQFGTVVAGLKVVLLFLLIRLGDEALVQPVIAKHSVHLHPLVFLLALLVGGELFGFAGLVFGVPAACVLKALFKVLWTWYSSEARLSVPNAPATTRVPYT